MKKLNEQHNMDGIQPGQVWKVSYRGNPHQWSLVIISGRPFQLKGQWYVRVIPTYLTPRQEDIDDNTDFVVKPRGIWRVVFLAEWWNERPVLVSRLAGLFGVVPDGVYSCLDWVLRYPERMTDPTAESVQRFREQERESWDRLFADSKQLCC